MHGVPASDIEEYKGMPMFAEVGPIKLDPKLEQQSNELSHQESIIMEHISIDNDRKASVQLLPNKLVTVVGEISFKDIDKVETMRNVNNIVVIGKKKFQFRSNLDRDLFTLVLRKLISKFNEDPTRMSLQDFFK